MHHRVNGDALLLGLRSVIEDIRKTAEDIASNIGLFDHAPPSGSRKNASNRRLNRAYERLRHLGGRLPQIVFGRLSILQERLRVEAAGGHPLAARAESTSRRTRSMASSP